MEESVRGGLLKRVVIVLLVILPVLGSLFWTFLTPSPCVTDSDVLVRRGFLRDKESDKTYSYDRNIPLIFIGGMARSGATLMRAALDAHPLVRCGEETRVIQRLLALRHMWLRSPQEQRRLTSGGMTDDVINPAFTAFILEIIVRQGEHAERLCNKDPFNMRSAGYLAQLFPKSKFLFMVRDGRAAVHSILSRKMNVTGFKQDNYRLCMEKWNVATDAMFTQCRQAGSDRCMVVYYEQLLLYPQVWMEKIASFLDLPWDDVLLRHEAFGRKPGGTALSNCTVGGSSDQVCKPGHIDALDKWVGTFPEDVVLDMALLAPMLKRLGYNADVNAANYSIPDGIGDNYTVSIDAGKQLWQDKAKAIVALELDTNSTAFLEQAVKDGLIMTAEESVSLVESADTQSGPLDAFKMALLPIGVDEVQDAETGLLSLADLKDG